MYVYGYEVAALVAKLCVWELVVERTFYVPLSHLKYSL
tara:strand:+ start:1941 stop:2054 length:114 start_codon:yes stop_codon:yes gene_type:complete